MATKVKREQARVVCLLAALRSRNEQTTPGTFPKHIDSDPVPTLTFTTYCPHRVLDLLVRMAGICRIRLAEERKQLRKDRPYVSDTPAARTSFDLVL